MCRPCFKQYCFDFNYWNLGIGSVIYNTKWSVSNIFPKALLAINNKIRVFFLDACANMQWPLDLQTIIVLFLRSWNINLYAAGSSPLQFDWVFACQAGRTVARFSRLVSRADPLLLRQREPTLYGSDQALNRQVTHTCSSYTIHTFH